MVGLNGVSQSSEQSASRAAMAAWAAGEAWPGTVDEILRLMTEIGESVAAGAAAGAVAKDDEEEKEPCRRIFLHAFRGDRTDEGVRNFKRSLQDNEARNGKGPSAVECLLYTGHVGISFNAQAPIYGFNPDTGDTPGWKVIKSLKSPAGTEPPYPGVITNDTAAFNQARSRGLEYKVVEYIYPKSKYDEIKAKFKAARRSPGLTYSFPGRSGDCNCATWPARIGINIPSSNGNMRAYMAAISVPDIRQEGDCDDG